MLDFDCPLLGGLWNKLFLLRQAPVCTYLATWRPSVQVWTECAKSCLTWDQPLALIAPGLQETRSQPLLDGALPNCPHCSPGRLQAPLVSTCTRTGLGGVGLQSPPLLPSHPGAPALELSVLVEVPLSALPGPQPGGLHSSSPGEEGLLVNLGAGLGWLLSRKELARLEGLPLIWPAGFYKDQSS